MTNLKFYLEKCRFCLETIEKKSFYPLHEYFEDLFKEITGISVSYSLYSL